MFMPVVKFYFSHQLTPVFVTARQKILGSICIQILPIIHPVFVFGENAI